MSKYNVRLKTLLLEGLSEAEFYGDLVYKFRKIIGKNVYYLCESSCLFYLSLNSDSYVSRIMHI